MTDTFEQTNLLAQFALEHPIPDTERGTFASYLEWVKNTADECHMQAMSATEAAALLMALQELAAGKNLSHSAREGLSRGVHAMFAEVQETRNLIDEIRLEINPERTDVPYRAIEVHREREAVVDDLFPRRPDAILNESRRVELIKLLGWTKSRLSHLSKLNDTLMAICRNNGVYVELPDSPDL